MKIHFCDLCNESVPQSDLESGVAVVRGGRVICGTCEAAMSGAPAPGGQGAGSPASPGALFGSPGGAPPPSGGAPGSPLAAPSGSVPVAAASYDPARHGPRGSAGTLFAGFLATGAILLSAGVTVLLSSKIEEVRELTGSRELALERRLDQSEASLHDRIDQARLDAADQSRVLSERLRELTGELEDRGAETRASFASVEEELGALGEQIASMQELESKLARHDRDLGHLRSAVAEIQGDVRLLAQELVTLAERPRGTPGDASDAAEQEVQPVWIGLLDGLRSPNPGERWSAVSALGETGDPKVAPHLVPMLQDADIFVRMATARILGDLGAVQAIGALIDALEDRETSVREAAVIALRTLSGRDFKFDPTASENERGRKVKAWREWWEDARSKYLDSDDSADA